MLSVAATTLGLAGVHLRIARMSLGVTGTMLDATGRSLGAPERSGLSGQIPDGQMLCSRRLATGRVLPTLRTYHLHSDRLTRRPTPLPLQETTPAGFPRPGTN